MSARGLSGAVMVVKVILPSTDGKLTFSSHERRAGWKM
jgi:hypothetical protein